MQSTSLVFAALRSFSTRAQRQRPLPHSKAVIRQRVPSLTSSWASHDGPSQPRLAAKYLRHAERVAWELGVVEELRQFEEAAAAFPNPPKLVAATILERGNMITRDLEPWEEEFLDHKEARRLAQAKQYPQELIDMWTVKDRVLEKGAGGAGAKKEGGSEAPGSASASSSSSSSSSSASSGAPPPPQDAAAAAAASLAEAVSQASAAVTEDMGEFYEARPSVGGGGGTSADGEAARALLKTPRQSSADAIGDTRSLDRAYSQRLFLIVCGGGAAGGAAGGAGQWGVPRGEVRAGEPMVQGAERALRAMFGEAAAAHLQVWYPSPAPIGHALVPYAPEAAAAAGCYGERVFFYRAELLGGRFRLPEPGQPPRSGCPYTDFHWLTRDESEAYLPRPLFKYLHQVVGAGAGEEAARGAAWRARLAAKGWSTARGTAARAHRVHLARAVHFTRLRALATGAQCSLAAAPWGARGEGSGGSGGSKTSALAEAARAYHDRVREQRLRGAASREALAVRPRVEAIRASLAATRSSSSSSSSSSGSGGGGGSA